MTRKEILQRLHHKSSRTLFESVASVGLFFGLPGLLIGPFVGAVAAEALVSKNLQRATRAGLGASLGMLFGAIAKIALAFTMLGVFALALLV